MELQTPVKTINLTDHLNKAFRAEFSFLFDVNSKKLDLPGFTWTDAEWEEMREYAKELTDIRFLFPYGKDAEIDLPVSGKLDVCDISAALIGALHARVRLPGEPAGVYHHMAAENQMKANKSVPGRVLLLAAMPISAALITAGYQWMYEGYPRDVANNIRAWMRTVKE